MNSTSANRAYLALVIAYAQIPLWGTSDTLGTLSAIAGKRLKEVQYAKHTV